MKKMTIMSVVLAMAISSCSQAQQKQEVSIKDDTQETKTVVTLSNKEKAVALLTSIQTGEQAPVGYINPNKYIQHNLGIADGLAGFEAVLQNAPEGGFKVSVIRTFQDGDYVFTQTDYDFFGPKIGFDVFRFEDGLIVEHWDNLAPKSDKQNPSGHTQLDGTTTVEDLKKTEENKTLVEDFVNTILIGQKYEESARFFDGDNYIQHNTQVPDGVSGFGAAVKAMAEQGIFMVYTKTHKILGEGNFVLVMSEGTFGGKPTAFYDLFRVENGKIAEHWDVTETIPAKENWKNSNGKF